MSDCNSITKILQRGGTDQDKRQNTDLDPNTLQLHGFGITEWMKFAYNFAEHVNFFDTSDHKLPEGNWQDFFKEDEEIESFLSSLEDCDELTPHLTLFICFLKLLELSSERFNGITKRHLDFYYKEVLQIEKLPAQYDKVHILFELSKNVTQEKLTTDTLLNGGRDAEKKIRAYQLSEEFVANKTSIQELRNVYFAHDTTDSFDTVSERQYIKASTYANSADGLGDPLPEDSTIWYPFGYHHEEVDEDIYKQLPDATLGFAISSEILDLSEGNRHLQFDFSFAETGNIADISTKDLRDSIEVYYTGAKKWIGPFKPETSATLDEINSSDKLTSFATKTEVLAGPPIENLVKLYLKLSISEEATAAYNNEIHLGSYETENPVFRFVINTSTPEGLKVYEYFSSTLENIDIKAKVTDMRSLILENDHGTLNPEKPMYPFTTIPVTGSSFTVSHEELLGKTWKAAGVTVKWKNQPDNFVTWYNAYKGEYLQGLSADLYQSASARDVEHLGSESEEEATVLTTIVDDDNYFTGSISIKTNNAWTPTSDPDSETSYVDLFVDKTDENENIEVHNEGFKFSIYTTDSFGELEALRISTNQSFLHELYPRLYAVSMTSESDTVIPNIPYTPFTEDVTLSYTAEDSVIIEKTNDTVKEEAYLNTTVQLYHIHPFGQSRVHPYLKSSYKFVDASCLLAPKYERGGELYVGLKDADHLQNVSLLVQVLEGSENPETSSFTGDEKVSWDILCNNVWKPLDSTLLLKNGIDNFLQSGIVTFKVPKEATSENTLLDSGLFWVRARLLKPFDAVCKILGVHAQATLAEFTNNDNELSHLEKGLEAETISKMIERSSRVKSILQPYNSFDGEAEENDEAYYRRVSERLRHKHRAVTLWDYEHLVLQNFPDIYKVKCLNHTNSKSYIAPGHVVLIVIPDTVNKNVFDIYQPQASTARRNQILAFIEQYTSLHVNVKVENPDYEELKVELNVQFYTGYDEALYEQQMKEDITKFLSPWAFETDTNVEFGVTLHKSVLIDYLEKLEYVDYLENVKMKLGEEVIQEYEPSSPKSILVSAAEHIVQAGIDPCETSTQNSEEECHQ